jgi:allantoate deiminase
MSSRIDQLNFQDLALQVIARCRGLAAHTQVAGETTRLFLSVPMRGVHADVTAWMTAAGMTVRVDAAGNIRGLIGTDDGPRLVIASHLDTVPNAGAFDGILGVMMGIAVVEALGVGPLAIEVIGFSEEEGVRFRKPFLGSMAVVGRLVEHLDLADDSGVTIREALLGFGLDPAGLEDARLSPHTMGYLEFHIEQGPVLESLDLPLAVVSALVGQTRMEFIFTGHANHAGTTPMHLRRDALAAAAEWVVAVERTARETEGLVATVGKIEALPGAGNVIPARVSVSLDARHADDAARGRAVAALVQAAEAAGAARGVGVAHRVLMEQAAVALDAGLTERLAAAVGVVGTTVATLTSGAGHDAMVVAPHVASAMLFLRSPGGMSHHPEENVLEGDVEAALRVGVEFVRRLAADL